MLPICRWGGLRGKSGLVAQEGVRERGMESMHNSVCRYVLYMSVKAWLGSEGKGFFEKTIRSISFPLFTFAAASLRLYADEEIDRYQDTPFSR